MRNSHRILAVLLSATLASVAVAGMQHSHSSTDSFVWVDDNLALSMHSAKGSGLVVDSTQPTPFHGLRAGDVIVAVNDRHIDHVDDLMQELRNHGNASATLTVRRAGANIALTWTHAEYLALLPPPPPPPPAPPPPPSAPPPPAPPPPPHY